MADDELELQTPPPQGYQRNDRNLIRGGQDAADKDFFDALYRKRDIGKVDFLRAMNWDQNMYQDNVLIAAGIMRTETDRTRASICKGEPTSLWRERDGMQTECCTAEEQKVQLWQLNKNDAKTTGFRTMHTTLRSFITTGE